jgi:hypothetical protein
MAAMNKVELRAKVVKNITATKNKIFHRNLLNFIEIANLQFQPFLLAKKMSVSPGSK